MVAHPFYPNSLLTLSYAAAPGTQHLTYKPSWCLVANYRGMHRLASL